MTPLAAYVLLFVAVGVGFIFVHLVAGALIRPNKPGAEKGTIYECGEPTIGSAWIQFDLRFYVVALLFVIFDVEVAFFFPWAEVFGKANAIANAPDPARATDVHEAAARYNALGRNILDLAAPVDPTSTASQGNHLRWQKLRDLTPEELAAFRDLTPAQQAMLRSLNREQAEALVRLTPEQLGVIRATAAALRKSADDLVSARKAALEPLIDAAKKQDPKGVVKLPGRGGAPGPSVNVPDLVTEQRKNDAAAVESATLGNLAGGQVPLLRFAFDPVPPATPGPLLLAARKIDPAAIDSLRKLSGKQVATLEQKAAGWLAELKKAGPGQTALWNTLNLTFMQRLDAMLPEQAAALNRLDREAVLTLGDPVAQRAKEQAQSIAWVALGEVLVFFGVLLVGFAYLWRRGDLAWVRSTAAEAVDRVEIEQAALVPEAARTLQHVGAGEQPVA